MADRYFVKSGVVDKTGNWSFSSGGPGGASIPTNEDTVYFDENSGPAEVNVVLNVRSIDFTGYENQIKLSKEIVVFGEEQTSGLPQFITLSNSMSFFVDPVGQEGNASIIILGSTVNDSNNKITVTSNGKKFPNTLVFSTAGIDPLFDLQDDFIVGGVDTMSSGVLAGTTLGGTGKLIVEGSFNLGNISSLSGGEIILAGTGNFTTAPSANLFSALTINAPGKTITFKDTVNFYGSALTYTAGTVITTGSTLIIGANTCTLNTNGITWNNVSVSTDGTLTISSSLRGAGTFTNSAVKTYVVNGTILFPTLSLSGSATFSGAAGTTGFNVGNLTLNTAGSTLTLKDGVTYTVTGLFTATAGTAASPITITSSHATNKALFKVTGTQASNTYINATRIDSSGGITLLTSGTLTQTTNWNTNATNTENMDYNVKGKVTSSTEEYFNCLDTPNLRVRVYKVLFGSTEELTTAGSYVTVGTNGTFNYNVPTNVNSFVVKLFLVDNGVEILAAESAKLCHHDDANITFKIDESTLGRPVYDKLKSRLQAAGLSDLTSITGLTTDQLAELSCLACISIGTLNRLKSAYALYSELSTVTIPADSLYRDTYQTTFNTFVGDSDKAIAILFGMLHFLATSLKQAFGFSRQVFDANLQTVIGSNEINSALRNVTSLNGLEASRNILLLNSDSTGEYYDAKLIHLSGKVGSGNTVAQKNDLINRTLDGGGLAGIITANPSAGDPLINVIPVRDLGNHLLNFAPFIKQTIDSKGTAIIDYWLAAAGGLTYWDMLTASDGLPAGATLAESKQAATTNVGSLKPSGRAYGLLNTSAIADKTTIRTALSDFKNFDIEDHSASLFFSDTVGSPNFLAADKKAAVEQFQRVLRLTGDTLSIAVTDAMYSKNYTSSFSVFGTGQVIFMDEMMKKSVSESVAKSIWCKAAATVDTTNLMLFEWWKYERDGGLMPKSMNMPNLVLPGEALPPNLPNITTIFGNQDTCACSACQSVYSASAYLTDLLNWLRKDVVKIVPAVGATPAITYTGLKALETMKNASAITYDRRKDIRYLKLNCANTNTLLPYIDIVNEILAINILRDSSSYPPTTAPYPSPADVAASLIIEYKKLQTTKTTEEIMVKPENRFPMSEALLNGKSYPWVLPYDVAFDETLLYSNVSGTHYHEVVKSFSSDVLKYDGDNWGLAYLGINPNEKTLFTTSLSSSSSFWKDYWGLDDATTTTPKVVDVLKIAGLSVEEANDIFSAFYINGATRITMNPSAVSTDNPCDPTKFTFSPGFTKANAENFMKMVRLKRKTGLATVELDLALRNLPTTAGTLDSVFLKRLAACIEFTKKHPVSFLDVMLWYNQNAYTNLIVTVPPHSEYYNKKFLNSVLSGPTRAFFNTTGNYVADISLITNEQKQHLSTVFNVSVTAIDKILLYLNLGTAALTKTNLMLIQQLSQTITIFNINPDELSSVLTMFGSGASHVIKNGFDLAAGYDKFIKLNTSITEFKNITEGTGPYTATNLDTEGASAWAAVEKAFQDAHVAKPAILFNTAYLPSGVPDIAYFTGIVLTNMSLQMTLKEADVNAIITKYNTSIGSFDWLKVFITDPDALAGGATSPRTWAAKKAAFMPVFRLLKRIVLLADIFNMEEDAIASGVEVMNAVKTAPGLPFYWFENTYPALTAAKVKDLLWIKASSDLASLLDMPQHDRVVGLTTITGFYTFVGSFEANPALWVATGFAPITTFYNALGANCLYKKLPLNEFTEIFRRAKEIAVAKDLVSVMQSFASIYETVTAFKANVIDAWSWVWTTVTPTTATTLTTTISTDVRRSVNGLYPDSESWSNAIVPAQNVLREDLRNALVAYHIGYKGFADENKIYAYYLLDTQMSSCMKTSRIVSATGSAQLMVHRALMGLEKEVFLDDRDKEEWEWRKNYRVWEANRKVFLYPENWIDPSIRKNKTVLFKEAEDQLQQDDINDRNCELAYANYLTGLNEVAHLDVRAVYVEDQSANLATGGGMVHKNLPDEIYHVFARNWNPPYTNYYRTFKKGVWSGWEKLDVEIASDHMIPAMFNRKLYLFFPMFVKKFFANGSDHADAHPYYEIQMCYTKFDFGKWSQKKVLDTKLIAGPIAFQTLGNSESLLDQLVLGYGMGTPNTLSNKVTTGSSAPNWGKFSYVSLNLEDFYFWAENKADGSLIIHCRRAFDPRKSNTYTELAYEFGFRINACDERVTIVPPDIKEAAGKPIFLARPYMTLPYYQQLKAGKALYYNATAPAAMGGDKQLFVKEPNDSSSVALPLLGNVDRYILTYPQQFKHNMAKQPFFFTHPDHSYFFRCTRTVPVLKQLNLPPSGSA